MTLSAAGTMNYECRARAGMAGAHMWTVSAPDAKLRHWSGWRVGDLYEGPTWAHRDGSRLRGALVGAVSAGAGRLPDQLWRVRSLDAAGAFAPVVFIRRTNAVAEPPPSAPCDASRVGEGRKAAYSADYSFYVPTRP